jgi:RNA polymerase sigma factor (sigma-70 family)
MNSGCRPSAGSVAFRIVTPQIPSRPALDAARSEQEALRCLADQFGPVLLKYFMRRVRDRSEVEDLAQEVYLRLWKRGDIGAIDDVRGYLFETAASVLTDRARKRLSHHSDRHDTFDPESHGNEGFPSDRVLIGQETLTRVSRALLELPDRARTIFVLRRLEGLRYQDIAERLGISLSLVEKQMARAVAYLTQRMEED